MEEEQRLWLAVILRALLDLTNSNLNIKKSAFRFLSGTDGALEDICHCLRISHNLIVREVTRKGAELGRYCQSLMQVSAKLGRISGSYCFNVK